MKIFGLEISRASVTRAMQAINPRGAWNWIVREPYPGAWQNDDEWSVDCVLAHHAVYSCITLIANDIGKLRFRLMQQDGAIWKETTNAAYSPVLRKQNRYQNPIQFRQWWITSKLLHGNVYGLKQRDERGVVTGIWLLDPRRTTPLVTESGDVYYRLQADNISGLTEQSQLTVPASEIIHDRMNCLFHPLCGTSPLFAAGSIANLGLAIRRGSERFFANRSQPGGILTAPGAISDATAGRLKEYFEAGFTGQNAGRIAVVGDGLKFEPLMMAATDSQLIEQLKWTAETICSTFHVPPYKVGIGAMPSYNNIEALQQDYYNTCLQTLIEEMEACLDEGLRLPQSLGVELDLAGLLRMDTQTQVNTLKSAVEGSLITIDEARARLNYGPVAGGSSIWMQQQNYSLEALQERDRGDPFPARSTPPAVTPADPESDQQDDEAVEAAFVVAFTKHLEAA
jgi:HK97 family phage portal protein